MKTNQTDVNPIENAVEFEPPTLTVIGEARDVVLGIPHAGWDWRGWAVLQFEFESDEN